MTHTQLTIDPAMIHESHCFYLHEQNEAIIFCGIDLLINVLRMRKAQQNSLWRDMTKHAPITIHFVTIDTDYRIVDHAHYAWIKQNRHPICNAQGTYIKRERAMIECIETGMQYQTQHDVCEAIGASQSALSNHLRHVTGYVTVRGFTFKKVMVK